MGLLKAIKYSTFDVSVLNGIVDEIYLPGYDVEVSDLSIYGYGTKTVVIRAT